MFFLQLLSVAYTIELTNDGLLIQDATLVQCDEKNHEPCVQYEMLHNCLRNLLEAEELMVCTWQSLSAAYTVDRAGVRVHPNKHYYALL